MFGSYFPQLLQNVGKNLGATGSRRRHPRREAPTSAGYE